MCGIRHRIQSGNLVLVIVTELVDSTTYLVNLLGNTFIGSKNGVS